MRPWWQCHLYQIISSFHYYYYLLNAGSGNTGSEKCNIGNVWPQPWAIHTWWTGRSDGRTICIRLWVSDLLTSSMVSSALPSRVPSILSFLLWASSKDTVFVELLRLTVEGTNEKLIYLFIYSILFATQCIRFECQLPVGRGHCNAGRWCQLPVVGHLSRWCQLPVVGHLSRWCQLPVVGHLSRWCQLPVVGHLSRWCQLPVVDHLSRWCQLPVVVT